MMDSAGCLTVRRGLAYPVNADARPLWGADISGAPAFQLNPCHSTAL